MPCFSRDKFVAPQDLYKYSVENLALQGGDFVCVFRLDLATICSCLSVCTAKQKKEAQEKEEMANLALEAKSNKGSTLILSCHSAPDINQYQHPNFGVNREEEGTFYGLLRSSVAIL